MTKYIMEVKINGIWKPIKASDATKPYLFDTELEADQMLRTCYPDQMIIQRLSGKEFGRVTKISYEE